MEQLDFLRNAGETVRFHTMPILRPQNIAEHSWHLTMLLYLMYGQTDPGITFELLMAGLTHDMAEHQTGDLPAPAKRAMDERLEIKGAGTFRQAWNDMEQEILKEQGFDWESQLSADELNKLKIADAMDGALYCVRERMMGNQLIAPAFLNFSKYIAEELGERADVGQHAIAWQVLDYVNTQWEIACGN